MLLNIFVIVASLASGCNTAKAVVGWQREVIRSAATQVNGKEEPCLLEAFASLPRNDRTRILPQAVHFIDLQRPLTETDRMGLRSDALGPVFPAYEIVVEEGSAAEPDVLAALRVQGPFNSRKKRLVKALFQGQREEKQRPRKELERLFEDFSPQDRVVAQQYLDCLLQSGCLGRSQIGSY